MRQPEPQSVKTLTTARVLRAIPKQTADAAQSLATKLAGRVKIRWNGRTGTPRSVRGLLTAPGKGSPQEIARQFLVEHRALFGLREDAADLQYIQTIERRGIRHVTFRQMCQNLPVFGAELIVHLDRVDRVQMVNGEYHAGIAVDATAAPVAKQAAIDAVLKALAVAGPPPSDVQTEFVILPQGERYCRAYKVRLTLKKPLGNWVYFVEAATGNVLDGYNAMRFAKGKGSIYNANPKRDANEAVTAELFDLKGDRTLTGTYFSVRNDQGPEALAPSDAQEFLYPAENTHFDESMAYYHLSKIGEFFRNLGYDRHASVMPVHVHVADPDTGSPNYDNAYFSPSPNAIYFGHGNAYNDLAKEEAVIYHEYAHAVIDAAQPEMATPEACALHEGYADYFACSLTNDPVIGEYVAQKAGQPYLRNLRQPKTYQDMTGSNVHADGEIWGVTCWKIREALGARVADILLYESLWFLPPNAAFVDACDGITQAETELFGGEHLAELDGIFTEQKIIVPPGATHTITASAGNGGTIVPAGAVPVKHGANQAFTLTANSGYALKAVLVDNLPAGASASYTFVNVIADHVIAAQFAAVSGTERTVIVPGNAKWMDTGLVVAMGALLTFAAHGTVMYDKKGSACGPEGASWTDTQDKEDPLWQQPHAGLIGKIGSTGAPFFIGKAAALKAGSSGGLCLGVNDYWYQGNTGEFTVTIRVSKTL